MISWKGIEALLLLQTVEAWVCSSSTGVQRTFWDC